MSAIFHSQPGLAHGSFNVRRCAGWVPVLLVAALAACDRRPSDPPKPATQFGATLATAGLTGLHGVSGASGDVSDRATMAVTPASDPPPTPIPLPAEQPASPASR